MRRGALLHQPIAFAGPKVNGSQRRHCEDTRRTESSHRSDEVTGGIEHPALDQEAIGRLAYFYWEERGCPNDSADEDWFRAEAELSNRLAVAASK